MPELCTYRCEACGHVETLESPAERAAARQRAPWRRLSQGVSACTPGERAQHSSTMIAKFHSTDSEAPAGCDDGKPALKARINAFAVALGIDESAYADLGVDLLS